MSTDQWLMLFFKLAIFDHAVVAMYLTIKFITWVAPKWWAGGTKK